MGEAKRRKQLDQNFGKSSTRNNVAQTQVISGRKNLEEDVSKSSTLKFFSTGTRAKTYKESLDLLANDSSLAALFVPEIGNQLDKFEGVLILDKSAIISALEGFEKIFDAAESEKITDFYEQKVSEKGSGCIMTCQLNKANIPVVVTFATPHQLDEPMMFHVCCGNKESNRVAIKNFIKHVPESHIPVMSYMEGLTAFYLKRK